MSKPKVEIELGYFYNHFHKVSAERPGVVSLQLDAIQPTGRFLLEEVFESRLLLQVSPRMAEKLIALAQGKDELPMVAKLVLEPYH